MMSLAPTTTGSATAIALIYPAEGQAQRPRGARAGAQCLLTDCVFELQRDHGEEVDCPFAAAAGGELAGILGYEERPGGQ